MVQLSAIAPWRLTRPKVGRSPVTPQKAAGNWIDPQVSEPMANGTSPAPTAAPGPLDEPPDQRDTSHGVLPGPVKLAKAWLYPIPPASSTMASLAQSTAPARRSRRTTVASPWSSWSRYGCAPQVVGAPSAASRSLTPYGMP